MPPSVFLQAVVIGAAALGLWLVVRLPSRAPRTLPGAAVQLLAALLVWDLATFLLRPAVHHVAPTTAVLLLVLPAATYLFAAAAWLMLLFQALIRQRTP